MLEENISAYGLMKYGFYALLLVLVVIYLLNLTGVFKEREETPLDQENSLKFSEYEPVPERYMESENESIKGLIRYDSEKIWKGYNYYYAPEREAFLMFNNTGWYNYGWKNKVFKSHDNVGLRVLNQKLYFRSDQGVGRVEWLDKYVKDFNGDIRSHKDLEAWDKRLLTPTRHLKNTTDSNKDEVRFVNYKLTVLNESLEVDKSIDLHQLYKEIIDWNETFKLPFSEWKNTSYPDPFYVSDVAIVKKDYNDVLKQDRAVFVMRNLDLVGVVDLKTGRNIYTWTNPSLDGPQAVSVTEKGTILFLDNGRFERNHSQLLELNVTSNQIVWTYKKEGFHSPYGGSVQVLPNGNYLITESKDGRAFELTPNKTIVWDYLNPHEPKEKWRETLPHMHRVSTDYWDNISRTHKLNMTAAEQNLSKDFEKEETNAFYFILLGFFILGSVLSFIYRKTKLHMTAGRIKALLYVVIAYLGLQTTLFFVGTNYSTLPKILLSGFMILASAFAFRKVKHYDISKEQEFAVKPAVVFIILLVLFSFNFSILTGDGSGVRTWRKHRAMLNTLYESPTSPTLSGFDIPEGFENSSLIYYHAQYQVPTYTGKLITTVASSTGQGFSRNGRLFLLSNLFSVWNFLGQVLILLLLPLIAKNVFSYSSELFGGKFYFTYILFTGLDYWYEAIREMTLVPGPLEWHFPQIGYYSSMISVWAWDPQHLLPLLLGLVLIAFFINDMKEYPYSFGLTAFLAGTPFTTIGLLPLLPHFIARSKGYNGFFSFVKEFVKDRRYEVIVCAVLILGLAGYYLSKRYPDPLVLNPGVFGPNGLPKYLGFIAIELIPIGLVTLAGLLYFRTVPRTVVYCYLLLLVIPLLSMGYFHDSVFRISLPLLCLLAVYAGTVADTGLESGNKLVKALIVLFYVVVIPFFLLSVYKYVQVYDTTLLLDSVFFARQYAGPLVLF